MAHPHQITNLRELFIREVPLLDVRAPLEFTQGAFPNAENHPLINNAEREQIGITYRKMGQQAALDLGHELVHGEIKAARIAAWRRFAEEHPAGVFYCFRGGLRSQISQQWLYESSGIHLPLVKGGYKAMRRFLLSEMEKSARETNPLVLGGRTGVGKTTLLRQLTPTLDLELLGWHRGSAFGAHATPQPSQVSFENSIAIEMLKLHIAGDPVFVVEDENRNVGSCFIPETIRGHLHGAPLVVLEANMEKRVTNIKTEYIDLMLREYTELYGADNGFAKWSAHLIDAIDKIRKRLGGALHRDLRRLMLASIKTQHETGATGQHRAWILELLANYYDPMYDYQIKQNSKRIIFTGDRYAVVAYLNACGVSTLASRQCPIKSTPLTAAAHLKARL